MPQPMKDLKQTKLSFTPGPTHLSQGSVFTTKDAPSKESRPQMSSTTARASLACVEITPLLLKRNSRLKAASKASTPLKSLAPSPKHSSNTRTGMSIMKRKLSPPTDAFNERPQEDVYVHRIAGQPTFSPASGASCRHQRPLVPKDNNLAIGDDNPVPSHKKSRLSSPTSTLTPLPPSSIHGTDPDETEFVPTSQSDEQELTLPRIIIAKDPAAVQESVVEWRKGTLAGQTGLDSCSSVFKRSEEIQMPESSNIHKPLYFPSAHCSAQVVNVSLSEYSSLQCKTGLTTNVTPLDLSCQIAPSLSNNLNTSPKDVPEVEAMDTESKTRQLIANIKARAYATAQLRSEQFVNDLNSLSDSGSDSNIEEDFATLIARTKTRAIATPAKTMTSAAMPEVTPRYNLRRNSLSSKPTARRFVHSLEVPKSNNPIHVLLREKKREERNGTGMAAVLAAEEDLSRVEHLQAEDEEDSDEDWERGLDLLRQSKPQGSSPVDGVSSLQRLLGGVNNNDADESTMAVGDILAQDMKENSAKAIAQRNQEPVGVPLWTPIDPAERDASMKSEISLTVPSCDASGNAMLQLLVHAARQNDVNKISALLSLGAVGCFAPSQYPTIVPWLADTAFSASDILLRELAYTQLLRLGPRVGARRSGLDFAFVCRVLCRMGASPAVLQEHGWSIPPAVPLGVTPEERDEMCCRLASVVESYADFPTMELSNVLLAMVVIGMDPTTPDGVRTHIRIACDSLQQAMGLAQQVALDACKKLIALGKPLPPPAQVLLVSFVPGTSASTTRMTRWVARSLLLNNTPSPKEYQTYLPELTSVVNLLMPEPGSCNPFDVVGNLGKDGFHDELTSMLSILGSAVSDVDEYTLAERPEIQKARNSELNEVVRVQWKEPAQKMTPLQQISRCLDLLHCKIVDTRAAHLDRSRAKAAIQRLSFRVHYQRIATMKAGGDKSDLRKYFPKSS